MNENYLWDKTGEDLEIEKLENALKKMRCRATSAPLIPAKTLAEKKSSFRFFPFAVPAMACAAFVLMTLSFWFYGFDNKPVEIAQTKVQPQEVFQPFDEPIIDSSDTIPNVQKVERIEKIPAAKRRIKKMPKSRPAYVQINTVTAQKSEKIISADVLTKDEKYAYDQLMTALAITSSQFKLVKDKIRGIEDQNSVVKGGQ